MSDPNDWFEGWEGYGTALGGRCYENGWTTAYGVGITYPVGRWGTGQSGMIQNTNGPSWHGHSWPDGAAHTSFGVGMSFKTPGFNGTACGFGIGYDINQLGSIHVETKMDADGKVRLARAGTTIASSVTGIVTPSTWHFLSMWGTLSNSGRVQVAVDGHTIIDFTGDTLHTSGTAGATSVWWGADHEFGGGNYCDDLQTNTTGTQVMESRIDPLLLNGDGGHLDWIPSTGTSHYALLDETTPNFADYLTATLAGEYDELLFQDLGFVPDSILGVRLKAIAAKSDAATRTISLGINSGGTVSESVDKYLTNGNRWFERFMFENPVTGVPWTISEINGLIGRPKVTL